MKVVLTGAAGFIGSHCLDILRSRGYEVHCVDLAPWTDPPKDVSVHRVDLLDQTEVRKLFASVAPTHLLHLAWYAKPGEYWTSRENFRWVESGINLMNAFCDNGGRRAVMAGTCAEYDWRYGYCSESMTPLGPQSLYGTCKNTLGGLLKAFCEETGLSAAWGRVFFLYGPREAPERLVSSVIRNLLRGENANCSHGNQIRDYLYVEDVARAFVGILESDVKGAVNIASGDPLRVRDIIFRIADALGKRELIRLGAIPSPRDEAPVVFADIRRLSEEVGFTPRFTLDEGIDRTIRWLDAGKGGKP